MSKKKVKINVHCYIVNNEKLGKRNCPSIKKWMNKFGNIHSMVHI